MLATNLEFAGSTGPMLRRKKLHLAELAPPPLAPWQKIIGDISGTTIQDRQRRAGGLRRLFNAVENLFRKELRWREDTTAASVLHAHGQQTAAARGTHATFPANDDALPAMENSNACATGRAVPARAAAGQTPPAHALHTFLWDPTRHVCALLGIAHVRLSAFMKELTGMAAHEIADRLRAKNVRKNLREDLRDFFRAEFGVPAEGQMPKDRSEVHWLLWKRLRASRGEKQGVIELRPRNAPVESRKKVHLENNLPAGLFDRSTWAIRHGFPNYARFRRACLLYYGLTPQQLEWELIAEIAKYYCAAESLRRRHVARLYGAPDGGPKDRHAALHYGADIDAPPTKPYCDLWSAHKACEAQWLAAMQAEFGLCGYIVDDE